VRGGEGDAGKRRLEKESLRFAFGTGSKSRIIDELPGRSRGGFGSQYVDLNIAGSTSKRRAGEFRGENHVKAKGVPGQFIVEKTKHGAAQEKKKKKGGPIPSSGGWSSSLFWKKTASSNTQNFNRSKFS